MFTSLYDNMTSSPLISYKHGLYTEQIVREIEEQQEASLIAIRNQSPLQLRLRNTQSRSLPQSPLPTHIPIYQPQTRSQTPLQAIRSEYIY